MKTKITVYCSALLLLVFAGSALGGHETDTNTWYGWMAGSSSPSGVSNTFIGESAGYSSTFGHYNTFIGSGAGLSNTVGVHNTYIGSTAGNAGSSSSENTFIGSSAGFNIRGNGLGDDPLSGSRNVFVGTGTGYSNTTGTANTYLGYKAGYDNTTGIGNVFIGYYAGYNETTSNKLYIDNSNTATPLIYGEFDNNIVAVNGKLGIGTKTPVRQLHVVGDQALFRMDRPSNTTAFMLVRTDGSGNPLKTFVVGTNASASNTGEFVINDLGTAVSGGGSRRMTIANDGSVNFPGAVTGASFTPVSSIVHKTNVKTYENALETVKKLRGVSFNWKDSGKPSVGLIAEEVDKVIPEVVAHNDTDATGVNYDSLVGVLVEAVKEQQAELDALKEQKRINEEQQKIIAAHSEEIAELKRLLIISRSVSKAD